MFSEGRGIGGEIDTFMATLHPPARAEWRSSFVGFRS